MKNRTASKKGAQARSKKSTDKAASFRSSAPENMQSEATAATGPGNKQSAAQTPASGKPAKQRGNR